MKSKNEIIALENQNITLVIKREDLIHPFVSGNKFRKLKYNIEQARLEKNATMLTFGGAFSNHIAAVAASGKANLFKTIGIIRGEELESKIEENPTLSFAKKCGMHFEFVSRETYKNKDSIVFLSQLKAKYGEFYLLPEGGTNQLAIKGCQEILKEEDATFDFICCSVGTGGTIAGLINSAQPNQKILGFPALKGNFLQEEIRSFVSSNNWVLCDAYHFGGYAKVNQELIDFCNDFYLRTKIPLDPIYTGKLVFGVIDLIKKNYFPHGSRILLIHTGGLQGIEGMNLKQKNTGLQLNYSHE